MHSCVEDLIRAKVDFRHGIAPNGWNKTFCDVCGDGTRTVKGPRGGWLFSDAGNSVSYNCFNCGITGHFDPSAEFPLSKKMPNILQAFGIEKSEYSLLLLKDKTTNKKTNKPASKSFIHSVIQLPDHWKLITELSKSTQYPFKQFLGTQYGLSISDYSFYMSTGKSLSDNNTAKALINRIILPYYKNGNLIYYQARDITNINKIRYYTPEIERGNIFFGWDSIFLNTDAPLYVVESAFDSLHLNGVATMQNKITTMQQEILNKSRRPKVIVPDFNGDYFTMAETAVANGWDLSIPSFNTTCKDVSESVIKYGKLYTAYDIVSNIRSSKEAKVFLNTLKFKKRQ